MGLIANLEKPRAVELARELADWLAARGAVPVVAGDLAEPIAWSGASLPVEAMAGAVDLALVLGGDGTLLAAAKRVACRGAAPLLGVNLGRLGFLTEIEEPDVYRDLPEFLAGRFKLDQRVMLRATVLPAGDEFLALNDVVVGKRSLARTQGLRTLVDGVQLHAYWGDGVIVSTPTGSTAYALAAGGPVLHPGLAVLLVTPICPHSFFARPAVISAQGSVRIETVSERDGAMLTLDGQEGRPLQSDEIVEVRLSEHVTRLVRRADWSFYDVLRRKLAEADVGEGPR